ncbi:MAG: HD domain-containing protein [Desulfonatronovibrionaceae bacterium]
MTLLETRFFSDSWNLSGAPLSGQGRSASKKLSLKIDHYFVQAWKELGLEALSRAAVVAVGGYGREELFPESDIDVLVLGHGLSPEQESELASGLFHPLWDKGLTVGHGIRTLRQCLDLAGSDFKILTSLLDLRFICGDKKYFMEAAAGIEKLIYGLRSQLADFLVSSRGVNICSSGAEHFSEPDIKNDPGGLRDYHLVLWLQKLFGPPGSGPEGHSEHKKHWPAGCAGQGFFPRLPDSEMEKAVDFLFQLRMVLHQTAGRKNDRLYLDLQQDTALKMGYRGEAGHKATEVFLGDLFRHQEVLAARAREMAQLVSLRPGISPGQNDPEMNPEQGPVTRVGSLLLFTRDGEPEPEHTSQIFQIMLKQGGTISQGALKKIKASLDTPLTRESIKKSWIQIFKAVMSAPNPGRILRQMRQAGILKLILPELEEKWFFVQFDGVHTYPLGEHCLHCLDHIDAMEEAGALVPEHLSSCRSNEALRLSALLHDIGKGLKNHSRQGALICARILKRMEYDRETVQEVLFLVRNHLLMMKTALKRDIDEEGVVAGFARQVGGYKRLRLLTCLSWADARAAGPTVWNDWQMNLLARLFSRAENLFQNTILAGHHAVHRMASVRDKIRSHAAYNEFWEQAMGHMPGRYLLKTPVQEIARHLSLMERFVKLQTQARDSRPDFVLETRQCPGRDQGCWDLVLVARDCPGLLARVAAALAMNQIDIFSAGLFSWDNGLVVDLFKVSPPLDPLYAQETWEEVRRDISGLLQGSLEADSFCRSMARAVLSGARFRIHVDNDSSEFYSIVEVTSPRHPCLTWRLTRCMAAMDFDVSSALISTHNDQTNHVFYLRTKGGEKITTTRELIQGLHQAVREVFLLQQSRALGSSASPGPCL